MAATDGDAIGDFANAGVLEGDAQPVSPLEKTSGDVDYPDGRGELLDLARQDPEECARKIKKLWELQDPAMKRRKVIWDQHKLWMMGIRGIRARPVSTDINRWELYVPPGALDMPPVLDQTESLLDKVTSHVMADKAQPMVLPVDDSPQERDGAQFAERWLTVMGGESGSNDDKIFRTGEKKAGIYGSSFVYHYVDQNGWEADAQAPDGRRWRQQICKKLLPPFYVRPIPETAHDIADADGCLVMDTTNVGDLKRRFPEITGQWSAEVWTQVVEWRPQASKWALPWYVNQRMNKGPEFKQDGTPTDASPVITLALYMYAKAEYPDGCYLLSAGGTQMLWPGPEGDESGHPDDGDWLDHSEEDKPRPLDLPIVQIKQLTDDIADDFYGRALIQMLGPIGEIRASIVLAWLQYLDRFTYPHTFLPLGSVVQPDQLAARDGRAIYFNPQGQPVIEPVPPFPPDAKEFLDRAEAVENDITGLYASTGEGDENVDSGVQLALQQSAAVMNITQISDNLGDAIERSWRVSLQHARAFIDEPQLLKFEDEDGSYREQEWQGMQFAGANEARIKPGTFTQMSQEARENQLIKWQQLTWIAPDEARDLVASGMRARVGVEDNPFLRKIRRELSTWRKGPTPEWMQQAQQQQAQQVPLEAHAQITGQPVPPPPPPPPGPFVRVASDMEQDVAKTRHGEIRRELSSSGFTKMPEPWQGVLLAEYQAMCQAGGVMTLAQQTQANDAQMQKEAQLQSQVQSASATVTGQANVQKATIEAQSEIQGELRKLAQEITLLREQAALKAGVAPAGQIMQDTLLRDSALFSATGPAVPFAPSIVPQGLSAMGAPVTPDKPGMEPQAPAAPPPGAGQQMAGAPTGPQGPHIVPGGQ